MKKDQINEFLESKIETEFLEKIMGMRFGEYAKYIIQDRAIPDVRDGLKPVQRRILYAMKMVGMINTEPYKKSARIVGEVIGKFHPHGDSSIYEALVRMSQGWKSSLPLIDMHGNNGSIDGDSAAAMRYTEARLSLASMYLLEDIEKKTVQFIPNYDDSEVEPVVLPAKFPNLLVNGADGISAGYATNIPPHNLNECINLTIERIKHPNLSEEEGFALLPGPDFPGGGYIIKTDGLFQAFKTGRGKVTIRSKYVINGHDIIISEIPYGVNKAELVRKIDEIGQSKGVDGILEVRDESDKEGLRIVIETKPESNPEVIINYLLKKSDLQINFTYNNVAIVDRSPKVLGALDIIDAYIQHYKEVITNRSYFELDKAKKRLHIVEGLIKLVGISDQVIETIRQSEGKADSKKNIIEKYGFSELQAEAIVTLQLYRLSKYDVEEFIKEKQELDEYVAYLELVLSDEHELKKVIINELQAVNKKISSPRRSEIIEDNESHEFKEEELIIAEETIVLITNEGYIRRLTPKMYQSAINANTPLGVKEGDYLVFNKVCSTLDTILVFTSTGLYVNIPVFKIPEIKYKELGVYIGNMFDLTPVDKIVRYYHMDSSDDVTKNMLLSTKGGKIKLTPVSEFLDKKNKKGTAMKLLDNDELIGVSYEREDYNEVITVTKLGYILRYPKSEVSVAGAKALGVKNLNLKKNDEVLSSLLVPDYYKEELLLLTNRGALKRIPLKDIYRSKRLGSPKCYLKAVKSNPFEFIDFICSNPSKFKEAMEYTIYTENEPLVFDGVELPKDTFENGVQIASRIGLLKIQEKVLDKVELGKVIKELSSTLKKSIEEIKLAHPNSLIDELGEIIETQASFSFDEEEDDESNEDNNTTTSNDVDTSTDTNNESIDNVSDDQESIDKIREDLF